MTIDVVFLEPCFPANQREFVRALHAVGARVTGIGERPKSALDPELSHWLFHYEQVGNVTDDVEVEKVVRWVQQKIEIDRLELIRPDLLLEITADGQPNWRFIAPPRAPTASARWPCRFSGYWSAPWHAGRTIHAHRWTRSANFAVNPCGSELSARD